MFAASGLSATSRTEKPGGTDKSATGAGAAETAASSRKAGDIGGILPGHRRGYSMVVGERRDRGGELGAVVGRDSESRKIRSRRKSRKRIRSRSRRKSRTGGEYAAVLSSSFSCSGS